MGTWFGRIVFLANKLVKQIDKKLIINIISKIYKLNNTITNVHQRIKVNLM